MSNNDTGSSFAIGFFMGAIIGLAVSMLYTPRSGKEFRGKLAYIVDDMSARIDKFSHPEKYSRIKP